MINYDVHYHLEISAKAKHQGKLKCRVKPQMAGKAVVDFVGDQGAKNEHPEGFQGFYWGVNFNNFLTNSILKLLYTLFK